MKDLFVRMYTLLLVPALAFAQPRTVDTVAEKSWVSYRLVHPLHTIDAKSTKVDYEFQCDPATKQITKVNARVDVTTFDSGNSNRDSHAMEVVDAIMYPDVIFASSRVTQRGDSLFVTGALTFHGVTKEIEMAGVVAWEANGVEVRGGFEIRLTDFKVDRPALLLVPVEDSLTFTLAAAFAWKD